MEVGLECSWVVQIKGLDLPFSLFDFTTAQNIYIEWSAWALTALEKGVDAYGPLGCFAVTPWISVHHFKTFGCTTPTHPGTWMFLGGSDQRLGFAFFSFWFHHRSEHLYRMKRLGAHCSRKRSGCIDLLYILFSKNSLVLLRKFVRIQSV